MNRKLKGIILALLIAVVFIITILIFVPEILIWLGLAFRRVVQVFSIVFIERWREWLIVITLFAAIILLVLFIAPILKFCFGRLWIYISIRYVCKQKNIRIKNARHILCPSKSLSTKKHIEITSPDKVYHIHFLNIIFASRREVFFHKTKYFVAHTSPSKLSARGATLVDGESWFDLSATVVSEHSIDSTKINILPYSDPETSDKHIIIIHSKPAEIHIINDSKSEVAYNGSCINDNLYYYTFDGFKKHLKENF